MLWNPKFDRNSITIKMLIMYQVHSLIFVITFNIPFKCYYFIRIVIHLNNFNIILIEC